jgi:apolipoprotein D and lipocalin family protein
MRTILTLLSLSLFAMTAAAAEPNMKTVDHVDLQRYMGRWNVISHTPNMLEKHKVGTSDNYTMDADGTIRVTFLFRKDTITNTVKSWKGKAHVVNTTTNADWKVQMFWPFTAGYHILELDPDYKWVVATTDHGKLIWIMARDTYLPEELYASIVAKCAARGLDVGKLEKVQQQ